MKIALEDERRSKKPQEYMYIMDVVEVEERGRVSANICFSNTEEHLPSTFMNQLREKKQKWIKSLPFKCSCCH